MKSESRRRAASRHIILLGFLLFTTITSRRLPKIRILEPSKQEAPASQDNKDPGPEKPDAKPAEPPLTDQEKEEEELSHEVDEEEKVRIGLVHRPDYAFKELDPENPEMNIKHDLEHDEEGHSEMQEYLHIFEDYNYENIEDQILKRKIELRFRSVLRYYHLQLQKILENPDYHDENVGPVLVKLFGENFALFFMDLKEIEISIKAALERTVDMFFLYKCADKNFGVGEGFKTCLEFKKDLKRFLMFENFFDIGFYNKIHDMFKVNNIIRDYFIFFLV